MLVTDGMRDRGEKKKKTTTKEQSDEVSKTETRLAVLCFHDIHVNDARWRFGRTG